MWFLTVFGLMCSSAAIWALSLPFAIRRRTCISRSESPAAASSRAAGLAARSRPSTFEAIAGEISDSPLAAARIPVTRSWIEESFSR